MTVAVYQVLRSLSDVNDVLLHKLVVELAFRVVALYQLAEVRETRVQRLQVGGLHGGQLAPVGPSVERSQALLKAREQISDRGPIAGTREVNGNAVGAVAGAHPQVISRNRADLRDLQHSGEIVL